MKAKGLATLAIAAFVVVLAWSFFSTSSVPSREAAVSFVLDDLRGDSSASDAVYSIFSADYSNSTREWSVVARVTLQAHSACPSVFVRTYSLLPIRRSLDKTVVSGCAFSKPIAYAEEAIIASRQDAGVAALVSSGASSCGFSLPLSEQPVYSYCPNADFAALSSAATEFSSARWLVSWSTDSSTLVLGVDSNGNIVGKKTL